MPPSGIDEVENHVDRARGRAPPLVDRLNIASRALAERLVAEAARGRQRGVLDEDAFHHRPRDGVGQETNFIEDRIVRASLDGQRVDLVQHAVERVVDEDQITF